MVQAAKWDAMSDASPRYWLIVALALVWNGLGCLDFGLTLVRDPGYLAYFPPDYVAYLDTLPMWLTPVWALGVGAGLLGSLLLALRSRWAVLAFALSLAGLGGTSLYHLRDPLAPPMGAGEWLVALAVWSGALALLVFAWCRFAGGRRDGQGR